MSKVLFAVFSVLAVPAWSVPKKVRCPTTDGSSQARKVVIDFEAPPDAKFDPKGCAFELAAPMAMAMVNVFHEDDAGPEQLLKEADGAQQWVLRLSGGTLKPASTEPLNALGTKDTLYRLTGEFHGAKGVEVLVARIKVKAHHVVFMAQYPAKDAARLGPVARAVFTSVGVTFAEGGMSCGDAAACEQACDRGQGEACRLLGFSFARARRDQANDLAQAAQHFERGCAAKDAVSCEAVAEAWRSGTGVVKDERRATLARESACMLGALTSCAPAGLDYERGVGVKTDVRRARELFTRGCNREVVTGCLGLALSITDPKDPKALTRALALLEQACDGGVAAACAELGSRVTTGLGVKADAAKGVTFSARACKARQPTGCANLGVALMRGEGTAVDLPGAIEAFQVACAERDGAACNAMGLLQASKKNPARDVAAGVKSLARGCALGETDACDNLETYCAKAGVAAACEALKEVKK